MIHAERLASARIARMATVTPEGAPHLVPITFVADERRIHTPIDHKPKSGRRLQRLVNIAADARVAVLADHYDEDWERLWWARADGDARVIGPEAAGFAGAAAALEGKYPQYAAVPVSGEIVEITVHRWTGWSGGTGTGDDG